MKVVMFKTLLIQQLIRTQRNKVQNQSRIKPI